MVKLIGSLIVLLVTSYMGFKMASQCQKRPQHIRQIISCIGSLRSHILYACLPLHEAVVKCTNGVEGPVAEFFHKIAFCLERDASLTPQEIMKRVLGEMENGLALKRTEREVLYVLAGNLGIMNCEEQEKYLSLVIEQLERFELEAIRLRDLNAKMYRYLGVCGGLAIVIVLI